MIYYITQKYKLTTEEFLKKINLLVGTSTGSITILLLICLYEPIDIINIYIDIMINKFKININIFSNYFIKDKILKDALKDIINNSPLINKLNRGDIIIDENIKIFNVNNLYIYHINKILNNLDILIPAINITGDKIELFTSKLVPQLNCNNKVLLYDAVISSSSSLPALPPHKINNCGLTYNLADGGHTSLAEPSDLAALYGIFTGQKFNILSIQKNFGENKFLFSNKNKYSGILGKIEKIQFKTGNSFINNYQAFALNSQIDIFYLNVSKYKSFDRKSFVNLLKNFKENNEFSYEKIKKYLLSDKKYEKMLDKYFL